MLTERFVAGLVGAPFGLKGFVKIRSLSGEIDHLLKLASVTLRQGSVEKTMDIEKSAPALPHLVMKFAGIDGPEAAGALRGAELLVGRDRAAPLAGGEYYVEDLRGMEVVSGTGEILGRVGDIIEGGGGSLAEIRLPNGETRLVPFRKEFFSSISVEEGRALLSARWILEP
ncbi:MAG: ribosome maturation factor RimM [Treponema sp.]|jgi:16S rRNA processing protein RimM|nr:ribosome maturation factor RimM [Treponema sp.]